VLTTVDERPYVADRFQAAIIMGSSGGFEASIRCLDGSQRVIFWNATLVRADDGTVQGLLCCGQDMTERKHWERELQKSEAYYRAIIEDQTELIVRFLPDGTITFVNEAFCTYHEVERWKLVGTSIFSPNCPCGHRRTLRQDLALLGRERPYCTVQHHFTSREGVTRWQEWTDRAIYNGLGELLGYQSVGRDITRLREAQGALLRSQERYLKLLESSSDVIFQITPDGMVAFVNHACVAVLGEEPTTFLDDPELLPRLVHPDSRSRYLANLQALREGRRLEQDTSPFTWQRRDGRIVYTENRLGILYGAKGEAESLLSVCRDVTDRVVLERERRELEAQIQETQKLESMSVLAGGIAHDFNNLLTGILGNAGLVLGDVAPDQPAREHALQIQTAAMRAADLTRQMLAYAGKGTFVVQPLNLSSVVREMTGILKTVISQRARLELCLSEDLPFVQADATQVSQIVMNLMTNASDALEGREGKISIRTGVREFGEAELAPLLFGKLRNPDEYVYLEVADTGCGMDEETRQRMFDPFFTRKPTGLVGGRGLGLAAVLGIVRNHQGAIQVLSELGRGTTFTVIFPKSSFAGHAPVVDAPRPEPEVQRSGHVLVVDDEQIVLRVARGALSRVGYEVSLAGDGLEAIAILEGMPAPPAAVIMDLRMPQMDGHTLSAQLQERYPGLPIVLMSGYTEREVEDADWPGGEMVFLEKPFSPADLVAALDEAVKRKSN